MVTGVYFGADRCNTDGDLYTIVPSQLVSLYKSAFLHRSHFAPTKIRISSLRRLRVIRRSARNPEHLIGRIPTKLATKTNRPTFRPDSYLRQIVPSFRRFYFCVSYTFQRYRNLPRRGTHSSEFFCLHLPSFKFVRFRLLRDSSYVNECQ